MLYYEVAIRAGARTLGEWGIGTIPFAVGAGFPECGGKNESGLHWDRLCDMGDLFYRNRKIVI